jgi:hypothetical protein
MADFSSLFIISGPIQIISAFGWHREALEYPPWGTTQKSAFRPPPPIKRRFDGQVKYDCFLRALSKNPPVRYRLIPAFRPHEVVSAKPSFDGHLTVYPPV